MLIRPTLSLTFFGLVLSSSMIFVRSAQSAPREQMSEHTLSPKINSADHRAQSEHWLDENDTKDAPRPLRSSAPLAWAIVTLSAAAVFGRQVMKQRGVIFQKKVNLESTQLQIVSQRWLGGGQALVLVEVDGERLLLAKNSNETTLLSHLPQATEPVVAPEAPVADHLHQHQFASELQSFSHQKKMQPPNFETENISPAHTSSAGSAWPSDLKGLAQWQARASHQAGASQ